MESLFSRSGLVLFVGESSEVEVELVGQGNIGLQANLAELRRDLVSFSRLKQREHL